MSWLLNFTNSIPLSWWLIDWLTYNVIKNVSFNPKMSNKLSQNFPTLIFKYRSFLFCLCLWTKKRRKFHRGKNFPVVFLMLFSQTQANALFWQYFTRTQMQIYKRFFCLCLSFWFYLLSRRYFLRIIYGSRNWNVPLPSNKTVNKEASTNCLELIA